MQTEAGEAELRRDLLALEHQLGDTRARYWHRKTAFLSAEPLIAIDREIRTALSQPLSDELQLQVHRLAERLRALDPH
ncbi:MAG TPA: hypothetical protein VGH20_05825 [Myxococcales bacterium]|jgi:hypothetical protein